MRILGRAVDGSQAKILTGESVADCVWRTEANESGELNFRTDSGRSFTIRYVDLSGDGRREANDFFPAGLV